MLNQTIADLYNRFRIHFYMQVFSKENSFGDSLTSVEAFSLECIKALGEPTVAEFAKMMGISAPNAAYKVNALVQKGYIEKVQSEEDHREFYLRATEKLKAYYQHSYQFLDEVVKRFEGRFSEDDLERLDEMLQVITKEMIPELDPEHFKKRD
ncbi:MAG TPA: MarR family transcriptional regulator [Oribacterium sp.]|nr:MarR family transcriptional regulator [Oribacterium sp.]